MAACNGKLNEATWTNRALTSSITRGLRDGPLLLLLQWADYVGVSKIFAMDLFAAVNVT